MKDSIEEARQEGYAAGFRDGKAWTVLQQSDDTKRLDWLMGNPHVPQTRAAIDAAMSQTKEKE